MSKKEMMQAIEKMLNEAEVNGTTVNIQLSLRELISLKNALKKLKEGVI